MLGLAARAGAQVTPEKTIPHPKPFLIQGDTTKPNVFISPGTESVTATTLAVTISYGDRCDLPSAPTITLNGQNVTSLFTYTGGGGGAQCTGVTGQATGTIPLVLGQNILTSSISNANFLTGADTVDYTSTIPVHRLRVTVAAGATHGAPSSRVSVGWTVTNLGNTTDTVNVKNHCNGAALNPPANCFSTPDSIMGLAPGGTWSGTAFVDLNSTLGLTGRLETIAFERTHTVTDTGYTDITIQNPLGPGVVLNTVTPDVTRPRDKCLT
ncbi:MAG TPA: hypothetical protein VK771_05805, partial [Acidimicrobiia bacterium]|nr:hypothetical protein [Acidimicrobiia bacterium]